MNVDTLKIWLASEWRVTKYREGFGHDDCGSEGTITRDGKVVGSFYNDGWGGETDVRWSDADYESRIVVERESGLDHVCHSEHEAAFVHFVEDEVPDDGSFDGEPLPYSVGMALDDLGFIARLSKLASRKIVILKALTDCGVEAAPATIQSHLRDVLHIVDDALDD